ncbi:MAG: MaoC family dehydratase N-terminal domain-containing protein [Chloroflexi bacterium]|nr:MaoC family dehydratase N-terminal domain-containing protein [Chloroflexota bacterium]MBP8055323.1 MaoC family dehydratase N-terminal domain-containing protein [Chloroflexota bacterium]
MENYIDVNQVLGYNFPPLSFHYTAKDVSLYALGVGAAADPLDLTELKFVYELSPQFIPLPTMAVTFPFDAIGNITSVPGMRFNPMMLLHGEQQLELLRPLPTQATLTNEAKITDVFDKGSGALIIIEAASKNAAGETLAINRSSIFIRGLGGFGGDRGPAGVKNQAPDRAPDVVHIQKTLPNQALLYRLAGDPNPLHADPAMAAWGGFPRPILHGLCTFGFAGRAVLKHFADNDPSRIQRIGCRFTRHLFPGETLVTEMWQDEANQVLFQVRVQERDEIVLANAAAVLRES